MMAYEQDQLGIRAHKSWMMIDNAQVAIGTAISASDSVADPVGTSVNQCNLIGDVVFSTRAGERQSVPADSQVKPAGLRWVHHDSIGYFLIEPQDGVSISTKKQSGSWRSINNAQPETPIELPVFSLDIDHGSRPTEAGYAYLVVAEIKTEEMEEYWKQNAIRVLERSEAIHAAASEAAGLTLATFFKPGTLGLQGWQLEFANAEGGACVMVNRAQESLELTVTSPDHREGELTFRTNLHLAGEGAAWDSVTRQTRLRIQMPRKDKSGTSVSRSYRVVAQ